MAAKRGPKSKRGKAVDLGDVEVPDGLSEAETAEFTRLVGAIKTTGTFGRCDVRLIEAAARTQVLIDRAYAELGTSDLTIEAANKTAMPHPMLGVINSLTMRLRGLLGDLGLTPKTSNLGGGDDAKADDRWNGVLNVAG